MRSCRWRKATSRERVGIAARVRGCCVVHWVPAVRGRVGARSERGCVSVWHRNGCSGGVHEVRTSVRDSGDDELYCAGEPDASEAGEGSPRLSLRHHTNNLKGTPDGQAVLVTV